MSISALREAVRRLNREILVDLYGKQDRLQELSERTQGNIAAHETAVEQHGKTLEEEQLLDQ